ncbi:hypothetical protein SPRG_02203 [Saprolegnia parasitica CBS 223.65]|uniref:Uncharacterized protein n=1 Tax=Saprolegnia parasitica (strain CBS 223.65) TaxID=695850 RepID=A0A067D3S8_SAPPC|nr:hypothetical protein SPRG_02203 [Saprolegnia parasitica CBS 223.65]KDO33396.1 hypothetical protein SPRG_02203 [Saprolegnia parasitica CBS 223.65]|eukprot:XP_012196144.1 hypothetical protein SPRG_02203 [Saprolegnia parasitica CBS 223.65]
MDDPLLCQYAPRGKCREPRARKPNGHLHSLCAHHRARQNANQRRRDTKLRRLKTMYRPLLLPYAVAAPPTYARDTPRLPPIRFLLHRHDGMPHPMCSALSSTYLHA